MMFGVRSVGFPLSLGALDGLCYFIVAFPGPPYNYFINVQKILSGRRFIKQTAR